MCCSKNMVTFTFRSKLFFSLTILCIILSFDINCVRALSLNNFSSNKSEINDGIDESTRVGGGNNTIKLSSSIHLNTDANIVNTLKETDKVDTTGELIFDCELLIPYNSVTPIEIHNLNLTYKKQIEFGIIQVHVAHHAVNLTLSYNRTLVPHYYQNGTSLGLVIYDYEDTNKTFNTVYIHNTNAYNKSIDDGSENTNKSRGVMVMIALVVYYRNTNAPIPGGCNLEYSMVQEAPIIIPNQRKGLVVFDTPLASASPDTIPSNGARCETNETKNLQYESRYAYLPSKLSSYSAHEYFNIIRSMITVTNAREHGNLAKLRNNLSNRRSFVTIPGYNIIFVTIVKVSDNESNENDDAKRVAAAYVPTIYSWNEYNDSTKSRFYNSNLFWTIVAIFLLLLGTVKCFINNPNTSKFFHISYTFVNIYVCSLLICVLFYLIVAADKEIPEESELHLLNLATIAPFAFVLSVILFVCCGFAGGCTQTSAMDTAVSPVKQIVQQFSAQIAVCYFITSFLIYFAVSNMDTNASIQLYLLFWLFTSSVIIIILPNLFDWYWNELILNALWGAFLIIMSMAIIIQSPLRILCHYTIRFILDTDEYRASLTPEFDFQEYLLTSIWVILAIIGIIFQHRQYTNDNQNRRNGRNSDKELRFVRGSAHSSLSSLNANERTYLINRT